MVECTYVFGYTTELASDCFLLIFLKWNVIGQSCRHFSCAETSHQAEHSLSFVVLLQPSLNMNLSQTQSVISL